MPPRGKEVNVVGIIYNLKKGVKIGPADAEAEYDHIETVHAVKKSFENIGLKVELFEADGDLSENLKKRPIDFAFNIAEGIRGRGREAQAPAVLNMLGIPFSGSDETTLCIALDKSLTKRLLSTYRIRTPKYTVLSKDGGLNVRGMKYPILIKPNAEGSSKGISDVSIVESKKELSELAKKTLNLYDEDMLAEEYIEGREFTVGVLGNGKETRVFSPMEIIYKKSTQGSYHVYSFTVKQQYKNFVTYKCPADISAEQEKEMTETTRKVFGILGCHDFTRVDFRMAADGKIYFIEVNPLPGLAPGYSDYPMLADFCGMDYESLVTGVLKAAIKRYGLILNTEEAK